MPTRRDFLQFAGAGLGASIAAARRARAADLSNPDFVFLNARVYTVDPATPQAEAFAVKAGRFTAIGSTAELRSLGGKQTQIVDARRATIVPGFIDCHNHAPGNTLLYE